MACWKERSLFDADTLLLQVSFACIPFFPLPRRNRRQQQPSQKPLQHVMQVYAKHFDNHDKRYVCVYIEVVIIQYNHGQTDRYPMSFHRYDSSGCYLWVYWRNLAILMMQRWMVLSRIDQCLQGCCLR